MNCIACKRPLLRYAASTPTRDGVVGWGPKCAAKAGVIVAPTRTLQPVRLPRARPVVDESQLPLGLEFA